MRVTLVTETYFPQVNGVSRTLDRLVTYLADHGDAVQLLVPSYPEGPAEAPNASDVRSFRSVALPFYREIRVPILGPRSIAKAVAAFQPDLMHICTEGTLGFAARRCVRRRGLPFVTSYHTNFSQYTEDYGLGFAARAVWRYLRWFHNGGRVTFCPTPSISGILQEEGFENLVVWGRGVDTERFHPARADAAQRGARGVGENETLLVYAGRVSNEKNLPMLVDAFELLPQDLPVKLLIVGDGPLREGLAAEADPRIVFAGYKRGEELAACYAAGDLFVFPSVSETFGNVMLEAMASGMPVIAYDSPGPRDVIRQEETGWVVSECAPEPMARAIEEALADPQRLDRMKRRARAYAETQTWDAVNSVVREAYEGVLADGPA